ncbi:hypothetical protein PYW08_009598 [Mythimna loreyi]|uniref:Uncharacterized protein n=1 Tax=Mythimna loreyi TaxID=667449 RepID=A0ACC2Q912_9NEOP|nr:hypothetical protein PYW08_009598 [Mythimna loreyi]
MVHYYIYAKDFSVSTNGVAHYHDVGLTSLEQFKIDVNEMKSAIENEESEIVYLHWGNRCEEVHETKARRSYYKRLGRYTNTMPETIIEWVKDTIEPEEDTIKLLFIITDGQINKQSVEKCLSLNKNINYDKVVFHAANEDLSRIDLSVTASFFKNQCTIYRNYILLDETDISVEFDYDKITTDNFTAEKENLKSYIKLKFLTSTKTNTRCLAEIEKLKSLKNRLNTVTTENFPDTMDENTFIREFKNTNWYKSFSNASYDLRVDIEKSITTLINYIVNDKKSYSFDTLKFENTFSNKVPEETIVDINFTTDQEIEFPDIIFADEKGIPVLLCTELKLLEKLVFKSKGSAKFSKFKAMMECPLFLIEDPDLNESLGYFYTLSVYKQLLELETKIDPQTRRPFHGGLVLVDTDDFDSYNDYILSATYFNFKKVRYNIGLFYYVLWKICEKKPWMDKNVLAQFKKYALRRVSTTKCKIGLSSLPLEPLVNTSLPTALWYCTEMSTVIFKDDPERFTHERLRMYYDVAHVMAEILINLNYKLDLDTINKRVDLIKHVMILKKFATQKGKALYMAEKIFKKVNGFLVSEIENSAYVKKLNYLKLKNKEVLRDDVTTEEVNLEEYVHFLYRTGDSVVNICEKTYRPFFMTDQDESFYNKLYKNANQVVVNNIEDNIVLSYEPIKQLEFSKIPSFCNLYLHCVKDIGRFPSLNEFRGYILRMKKFTGDLVTIFPINVCSKIEEVFVSYETVIKGVTPEDFIETSDKYMQRLDRIKGETKVDFESDSKVKQFIVKEERRVNLKIEVSNQKKKRRKVNNNQRKAEKKLTLVKEKEVPRKEI